VIRAFALLLLGLVGCGGGAKSAVVTPPVVVDSPPAPAVPAAPKEAEVATPEVPRHVVLVTIDGVRWEDVLGSFATAMPNLERLVREGGAVFGGAACPHDMRASGPSFVSLPGYVEIFTGKATTCTTNDCPPVKTPTVLDDATAIGDVAVFASWDRYANAVARDRGALVLSAGTKAPAAVASDAELGPLVRAGMRARGYPGWGDYRPDAHTARLALTYLERKQPRVLVLGLGDADEQAHRGDFPGYRRAIARADGVLGELAATLDRMGDVGKRTAVLVTTDHGRGRGALLRVHGAAYPGSERVFLASFGDGIAHRGVACAKEPLRLADVAGAMKVLLGIDARGGPLAQELAPPSDAVASE
jgi:hypothetical protein